MSISDIGVEVFRAVIGVGPDPSRGIGGSKESAGAPEWPPEASDNPRFVDLFDREDGTKWATIAEEVGIGPDRTRWPLDDAAGVWVHDLRQSARAGSSAPDPAPCRSVWVGGSAEAGGLGCRQSEDQG